MNFKSFTEYIFLTCKYANRNERVGSMSLWLFLLFHIIIIGVAFQRTCCTVSWNLGRGSLADLSCASRMSARETCLPLVCQQATGRHAADRGEWRSVCSRVLQVGETRLKAEADERRAKRKAAAKKTASAPAASDYICGRCRSRIGLLSHERKCWSQVR